MAAHRQIAAEFGNQADEVVAKAQERHQNLSPERLPDERRQQAQAAVTFDRDRSFEREAVTDERAIFVDAMRRGMGQTTYPEVRANFEARVASGEFRTVAGEKHDTGRQFTTAETIRAEKEIVQKVLNGQGRSPQIMQIQEALPLSESHSHLNRAQRQAVEQVLTSHDQVQGLHGSAGVGKSTTLSVMREGAEQKGYSVEGFAPTSRAAQQLREVGVAADTLQGFLARSRNSDPAEKHLYMVDESSLASTKQMREFLEKIGPQDKVLLIGDTRQHQGVDAGKPFEQLQQAGMQTAQLDQIVRQRDPELLKAVEHLSKNETAIGVQMLQQQGRITEIVDANKRIEAIAKSYAARPENTIIVSPDNASRRQINQAVRRELQALGTLEKDNHSMRVLTPRSDMTGADRAWAARYQTGDVLHYIRGSKELGIERGSYAQVMATNPNENLLTVRKQDGEQITYDPARLRGISAYREIEREFAIGDRLQWTAPSKDMGVANRDLGTVQQIDQNGRLTVRMDGDKERLVTFDPNQMRHFDHGYAVTSYSSQGLTADRVLVNVDTHTHRDLISSRFAYVSVSRASNDAHVFTNNAASLSENLCRDVSKASALDFAKSQVPIASVGAEQAVAVAKKLGVGRELSL
jgi:ATP-dependent exoDNAse (exonuclease V) alpha subunit